MPLKLNTYVGIFRLGNLISRAADLNIELT